MSGDKASHALVMGDLKAKLSGIAERIDRSCPVVYLDYPVHDNVGDLLIHQGADAFLDAHGYRVLGRFSFQDLCRVEGPGAPGVSLKPSVGDLDRLAADRSATLVLHGGGNLGDIWPTFQRFRELVIERYPDNRIVILPQSIHFGSAEARGRSAAIFAGHRRLFTFVRDVESLGFVTRDCSGEGAIMPDMAHQLWGTFDIAGTGSGTLVQRRRDKESRTGAAEDGFDWVDILGPLDPYMLRALRKWQTIDNPLRHVMPNHALWRPYRDRIVRKAVERFAAHDTIDTDRLHGMILGALLGKHVRYGDGTYGKLHRYAQSWLARSDRIESALTPLAAE